MHSVNSTHNKSHRTLRVLDSSLRSSPVCEALHMRISALLIILVSSFTNAGGPVLPEKWREATDKETYQEYSDSHLNTLISGDFNGDGLTDGATIVITSDNKKQELVVFLYDKKLNEEWQVLDSLPFSGFVSMGLAKVSPRKTKALCETDEECNLGYKKELILKNDAIDYFRPESANSLFIYKNGAFEQVWQSD